MQDDCDEIYPAMLVNTMSGQAVYDLDLNTAFESIVYGPRAQNQNGE